jgi:hypothetical protein
MMRSFGIDAADGAGITERARRGYDGSPRVILCPALPDGARVACGDFCFAALGLAD